MKILQKILIIIWESCVKLEPAKQNQIKKYEICTGYSIILHLYYLCWTNSNLIIQDKSILPYNQMLHTGIYVIQ